MTTELTWLFIGWATAGPLVWVGFVAYQAWTDRRVHRVEMDERWQALRRLSK